MANVLVQESSLQDIADAIRSKNGTQNTYKPAQMADAIEAISGGSITPTGTINITANGTHDVTNYASANVNVPTGGADLGTKTITTNGTYDAEDDSLDGYSSVTVNVPSVAPTGTKQISITSNGTTTEDVSAYANAEITVNVASGGGSGGVSLLEEVTIQSDTHEYNLDLTDYQNYNFFFVYLDVELTASDWLYFVKNGSSASGGSYDSSATTHQGICALQFNPIVASTSVCSGLISGNIFNFTGASTAMTNLYIYTYVATKYIKAGSKIKIYGGNYADM